MTTWHIMLILQAPRGADITMDAIESMREARPEFTSVSRLRDNQLEFSVDADNVSSAELYAIAVQRAAEVSTDVLGFPVELLRAEITEYGHWLEQIDPNGAIRSSFESPRNNC